MNPWEIYEVEKKRIASESIDNNDYAKRIAELCERSGI
jgi:hypothetical protein